MEIPYIALPDGPLVVPGNLLKGMSVASNEGAATLVRAVWPDYDITRNFGVALSYDKGVTWAFNEGVVLGYGEYAPDPIDIWYDFSISRFVATGRIEVTPENDEDGTGWADWEFPEGEHPTWITSADGVLWKRNFGVIPVPPERWSWAIFDGPDVKGVYGDETSADTANSADFGGMFTVTPVTIIHVPGGSLMTNRMIEYEPFRWGSDRGVAKFRPEGGVDWIPINLEPKEYLDEYGDPVEALSPGLRGGFALLPDGSSYVSAGEEWHGKVTFAFGEVARTLFWTNFVKTFEIL